MTVFERISYTVWCWIASRQEKNEALIKAAGEGKLEDAEFLLARGARINAKGLWQNRPVHEAAWHGRMEMLEFLLAAGARVDSMGVSGMQPLHIAAMRNDKEMVEALLAHDAPVSSLDYNGKMPGELCKDLGVWMLIHEAEKEVEKRAVLAQEREALAGFWKQRRKLGGMRPPAPRL